MTDQIKEFDAVVIGSGPGGEGASMQISKAGKNVAVIERYAKLGGGCTHWGTIPSKALRSAIFQMTEVNNNRLYREMGFSINLGFPELRRSAKSVIEQQTDMRKGFYDRNQVDIIPGQAAFLGRRESAAFDGMDMNHDRPVGGESFGQCPTHGADIMSVDHAHVGKVELLEQQSRSPVGLYR